MEMKSNLLTELNNTNTIINLAEIPQELLELILLELNQEQSSEGNQDISIYNFSQVCKFFNYIISSSYKLWEQRYFKLLLEKPNLNFKELLEVFKYKDHHLALRNLMSHSATALKYNYYLKKSKINKVIYKLIESIENNENDTDDGFLYNTMVTQNLFANINPKVIAKHILTLDYDLNYTTELSQNILHYFVFTGDTEAVSLLVEAGANINQFDNIGMTPLGRVIQGFYLVNRDINSYINSTNTLIKVLERLMELRINYIKMTKYLITYNADIDSSVIFDEDDMEEDDSDEEYIFGIQQNDVMNIDENENEDLVIDQDEMFSATVNELFRTVEYLDAFKNLERKDIDMVYELAAIILSQSHFKNNFEEYLDANDINLNINIIQKIRNAVDNFSDSIEKRRIKSHDQNDKFDIRIFLDHIIRNINFSVKQAKKYSDQLSIIVNQEKNLETSFSNYNFFKVDNSNKEEAKIQQAIQGLLSFLDVSTDEKQEDHFFASSYKK